MPTRPAPYPASTARTAWPWLTEQLLAVQLLSVEGAGPIEQGVVFGVHRLDLIQRGFATPDPLCGESRQGR